MNAMTVDHSVKLASRLAMGIVTFALVVGFLAPFTGVAQDDALVVDDALATEAMDAVVGDGLTPATDEPSPDGDVAPGPGDSLPATEPVATEPAADPVGTEPETPGDVPGGEGDGEVPVKPEDEATEEGLQVAPLAIEAIDLTVNGSAGPLTVPVGETVNLQATGLVPDADLRSTNAFGDCSGIQRSSFSGVVPASGTYEVTWALDYPVTLGFWVESDGATSNCVIVTWENVAAPVLTVNGSSGAVEVPFGTTVDVAVSGLASGASVALQLGEFTCYNNPTTIETGTAAGDGTFSTTFPVAAVGHYHLNIVSNGVNSNCVIVQGVQGAITLTGNGSSGPIVVSAGEPVDLVATGLEPDADLRSTNAYGDCAGTQRSSFSGVVPASGTYGVTWDLDYPVTLGFWIESNEVRSNCVIVTWENDSAPVLAVNGSAGPVEVPVGTVANLTVTGLLPGSSLTIEQGEFTCYNNTTVLETGVAAGDGTFSTTYEVENLGTAFLNVRSESVNSNCVFVEGVQGPIALAGNGGPGPIVVPVGETVEVLATGLVPGMNMTFGNSFGDCDGPRYSAISAPATPDGTYTLLPALDYPVTLGFQVESNGMQSNCVIVTWVSDTAPVLTVNGSSALHVQAVVGDPVDVVVSGLAPGAQVTLERGGFVCYFPPETLATGVADDDGVFRTTFTPPEVGTYYLGVVSGDTRSNCVILQAVETLPTPTPTPTATATATVTPSPTASPPTPSPTNLPATSEPTTIVTATTSTSGSPPDAPNGAGTGNKLSTAAVAGNADADVAGLPVTGAVAERQHSLAVIGLVLVAAILLGAAGSMLAWPLRRDRGA